MIIIISRSSARENGTRPNFDIIKYSSTIRFSKVLKTLGKKARNTGYAEREIDGERSRKSIGLDGKHAHQICMIDHFRGMI